ncbi:MAG TPA: hypothetical protein DHV48_09935 [Prolixibacteraceae bacterium]|nr:hypothetical protein [Prolixibacteraceae bacterium]
MKDIGYLVARKRQSRKIFIVKSREKLVRCRAIYTTNINGALHLKGVLCFTQTNIVEPEYLSKFDLKRKFPKPPRA